LWVTWRLPKFLHHSWIPPPSRSCFSCSSLHNVTRTGILQRSLFCFGNESDIEMSPGTLLFTPFPGEPANKWHFSKLWASRPRGKRTGKGRGHPSSIQQPTCLRKEDVTPSASFNGLPLDFWKHVWLLLFEKAGVKGARTHRHTHRHNTNTHTSVLPWLSLHCFTNLCPSSPFLLGFHGSFSLKFIYFYFLEAPGLELRASCL
jgi:hypothetical protein